MSEWEIKIERGLPQKRQLKESILLFPLPSDSSNTFRLYLLTSEERKEERFFFGSDIFIQFVQMKNIVKFSIFHLQRDHIEDFRHTIRAFETKKIIITIQIYQHVYENEIRKR